MLLFGLYELSRTSNFSFPLLCFPPSLCSQTREGVILGVLLLDLLPVVLSLRTIMARGSCVFAVKSHGRHQQSCGTAARTPCRIFCAGLSLHNICGSLGQWLCSGAAGVVAVFLHRDSCPGCLCVFLLMLLLCHGFPPFPNLCATVHVVPLLAVCCVQSSKEHAYSPGEPEKADTDAPYSTLGCDISKCE